MKTFCVVLALLSTALAAPHVDKRLILDSFNTDGLNGYLNQIVDLVGSDATEQQCETACIDVVDNLVLETGCPLFCSGFQSLVGNLHINATAQPAKRFLFGNTSVLDTLTSLFSGDSLSGYVNQIVDMVGSDATEQQCETACLEVVNNNVLDTGCPLVCTSLQALVQHYHIDVTTAQPAKRFIADSFSGIVTYLQSFFSGDSLAVYVNQIVDMVGSDATEAQCETACLEVINNDLLDTACPLVCTSLQSLANHYHIDVTTTPMP